MFFESLKPLREQFEAPDIAEIMINNFDNVWIERRGVMTRLSVSLNQATLNGAILSLAASVEKSARAGTSQGIINAGQIPRPEGRGFQEHYWDEHLLAAASPGPTVARNNAV